MLSIGSRLLFGIWNWFVLESNSILALGVSEANSSPCRAWQEKARDMSSFPEARDARDLFRLLWENRERSMQYLLTTLGSGIEANLVCCME